MIYLASPYTHPEMVVMLRRYREICRIAADVMMGGKIVFCPIAMTHPMAVYGELSGKWDFWRDFDTAFLEKCDELWVTMMDGWRESTGVTAEIAIMHSLVKPVRYLDPLTLQVHIYPSKQIPIPK